MDEPSSQTFVWIDEQADRFEQQWKAGGQPRIEDYVAQAPPRMQGQLLRELLAIDVEYRQRHGQQPREIEYAQRFPQFSDVIDNVFAASPTPKSHWHKDETLDAASADSADGQFTPGVPLPCQFGDYVLLEEIGRGGMGVVYKARQGSLDRVVALKMILSGHHASGREIRRFRAEAEAAAQLDHPHIVPIHQVGQYQGWQFFSMAYVAGNSLAEEMVVGPFPPERAAELIKTLSYAVAYAHQRGVVHRDLKPSNILLDNNEQPRVTDFGLAKRIESDSDLTATGQVLGTPTYMAPEQAAGRTEEVGPLSDVYSLGAILYCLLTGNPPFQAAFVADLLAQVQFQEPVSVRRVNPSVPRDLETTCLKCLSKRPGDRYASASELAEDLDRYLTGAPVKARRISALGRAWRWCRVRPALSSALASLFILLMVVLIASPIAAIIWRNERDRAREAELQAKQQQYVAHKEQAHAAGTSGGLGQRFDGLAAVERASSLVEQLRLGAQERLELRNHAITCMSLSDARLIETCKVPKEQYALYWKLDKDFKRLAYSDAKGNITLLQLPQGKKLFTLPGMGVIGPPAHFNQAGNRLISIAETPAHHTAILWDLNKQRAIIRIPATGPFVGAAFDDKNDRMAVAQTGGEIQFYDSATGKRKSAFATGVAYPGCIFNPAGSLLAVTGSEKHVEIYDVPSGVLRTKLQHSDVVKLPSWSGDGRLLAVPCNDRKAYVWDVAKQSRISVLTNGEDPSGTHVSFHPTQPVVASGANDGIARLWDALSGEHLLQFEGAFLGWRKDGQQLAIAQNNGGVGTLALWEFQTAQECRLIRTAGGPLCVACGKNGRLFATGNRDGVRLWDLDSGSLLNHIASRPVYSVVFGPKGDSLLACGDDGVRYWPLRTPKFVGEMSQLLPGGTVPWPKMSMNSDGSRLITWASKADALVTAFSEDDQTTRELFRLSGHAHQGRGDVAISRDGKWAAVAPAPGVKVWNARSGKLVKHFMPELVYGRNTLRFSPDGRWLVSGIYNYYRLWDVRTWKLHLEIGRDGMGFFGPMAFSPDGRLLAIAHTRYLARLIDPNTGDELATLRVPDPQLDYIDFAFTPDGNKLIGVGANNLIRIWDLKLIKSRLEKLRLSWD